MNRWLFLLSIIIILFIVISVAGQQRYILYEFTTAEHRIVEATLTAKLNGTFESNANQTIKGSPYTLIIWVDCNDMQCEELSISNLKLSAEESTLFVSEDSKKSTFGKGYEGRFTSNITFQNLKLPHVPITLDFDYSVRGNKQNSGHMNMRLDPILKKYNKNKVLEMFMSV